MKDSTIRELSLNDLASVVRVHLNAFSDRALASLGPEAVRRYYEWQLIGPHDAIAMGIFQEEAMAGYCFVGVFRGAISGFLRKNRAYLTWRVVTHPWLIISPFFRERMLVAWNVLTHRPVPVEVLKAAKAKSFGILAIAVDPKYQGEGYGYRLMAETEKIAIQRGFSHFHLTVDVGNNQAITFYEKLGWKKVAAYDGMWHGFMTKQLNEN